MTAPTLTLTLRCTPEAYAALRAIAVLMPGVHLEDTESGAPTQISALTSAAPPSSLDTVAAPDPAAGPSLREVPARPGLDWLPQLDPARTGLLPVLSPTPGERHTRLSVHSDGSANPNPGRGGAALVTGTLAVGWPAAHATNNEMELLAALGALRLAAAAPDVRELVLHSDSKYVVDGMTSWMPGWVKKGWKRPGGAIENLALWQALHAQQQALQTAGITTRFVWVKAHATDASNNRADELAALAGASQTLVDRSPH
ncbi:RNase H family protein [Deinococcus arcticus]|uniref:ribonuclease H n=1 Tax=Deinococcus arcticus TaxID=2136176 RepID=A0A2T3W3I9_9DEIO|nr:RNase H family protein [Deinococcus arcticus]PTA66468.1 hypothetical protein C8263_17685 [Deinococcus arcticus]